MKPNLTKTEQKEIERVRDRAVDNRDKFPGLTYMDGVANALDWILGATEETPVD